MIDGKIEVVVERVEDLGDVEQDPNLRGRDGGYSSLRDGKNVVVRNR